MVDKGRFPVYDSMDQMSSATGVPLEILKSSKREGCTFVIHGRCDSGEFFRWWFGTCLNAEERENWTRRDKRAAALIKECVLDERRGESIGFERVRGFLHELVRVFFVGEWDRMAQELPPALRGLTEPEIRRVVLRQKDSAKKAMLARLDEWELSKGKE